MLSHPRLSATAFCLSVLLAWTVALCLAASALGVLRAGDRYNLPLWTVRNLARSGLNPVALRLGAGYRRANDGEIVDFFGRASGVAAAERDVAYAEATSTDPRAASDRLQVTLRSVTLLNQSVAERLSGELDDVLRHDGLSSPLAPFALSPVWPPVRFAYDLPPYLLIESPRDRIELTQTELLRGDLTSDERRSLEMAAESEGSSALIVRIGGLATYPSMVEQDDGYADALELIAHEWSHQYLFFHPLGVRYFQDRNMTTINETVANIIGRELAARVREEFPLPAAPGRFASTAPPPDRSVNFDRTMHDLRLEVDVLLAAGQVNRAQSRMNETRDFLVAHGYYVPRINQAYFAFYGTYADSPASSSPIGPRLGSLRSRYGSLRDFVHAVENIRSPEDFSRLLGSSGG